MSGIITSFDKLKDSPDLKVVLLKLGENGDHAVLEGLIESMPTFGVSVSYNAPGAEVGDKANSGLQVGAKAVGLNFGALNNLKATMKFWSSSEVDSIPISILIFGKGAFGKAWRFYASCFPGTVATVSTEDHEMIEKAVQIYEKSGEAVSSVLESVGLKDKSNSDNTSKSKTVDLALTPPFWGGGDNEDKGTISLKIGTFMRISNLVVDSFSIEPSQELMMDSSRTSHPMWVRCSLSVSTNRRRSASEVDAWYIGVR